jgi:hypothetical protein
VGSRDGAVTGTREDARAWAREEARARGASPPSDGWGAKPSTRRRAKGATGANGVERGGEE